MPAGLHLLHARGHQAVDLGISRAGPQQPQAPLGEFAHERAFVAQALEQQGLVLHAAVIREPDHALGAPLGLGIVQRGERFLARRRRRECIRSANC